MGSLGALVGSHAKQDGKGCWWTIKGMLILKATYVEEAESRPHVLPTWVKGRADILGWA